MDEYIQDFADIIRNGSMDNTYKMAWGRALVEYCVSTDTNEPIHFSQLAPLIFKYYWDQTIFFNLRQSPQLLKPAVILQLVIKEISKYQSEYGYKPGRFIKVEDKINIPIDEVCAALKSDVCHRFLKVGKQTYDIYDLDLNQLMLQIKKPETIKLYSDLLFELINYRWTQKLEEFNAAPRLSQKVRGTDRDQIKRTSLRKFHKYLDLENPNRISFVSGVEIPEQELSVDHVIPWSYMYSNDLWNLVYVSKSENSVKNNRLPTESMIKKLKERNGRLLLKAKGQTSNCNEIEELKLSIKNDYVTRYWVNFKG